MVLKIMGIALSRGDTNTLSILWGCSKPGSPTNTLVNVPCTYFTHAVLSANSPQFDIGLLAGFGRQVALPYELINAIMHQGSAHKTLGIDGWPAGAVPRVPRSDKQCSIRFKQDKIG